MIGAKNWASINYAAAWELADEDTQRIMGETWNAALAARAAQAARAKGKAELFDEAVRLTIEEITATRLEAGQPPLENAALTNEIAARLHTVEQSQRGESAAQLESVRKRVLRSLDRQRLR